MCNLGTFTHRQPPFREVLGEGTGAKETANTVNYDQTVKYSQKPE